MADQSPAFNSGEGSAEEVAYRLLQRIAAVEGKTFSPKGKTGRTVADRLWILNTYSECIEAVRGLRFRTGQDDVTRRVRAS